MQKFYHILLVDDDAASSEAAKYFLETPGDMRVCVERDPRRALEQLQLQSRPCDCLLLDINMPGMNGYELLRQLRRSDPRLQILVVSVRGEERDVIQGLTLGADDYLIKPFSLRELRARIEARLRRSANPSGTYHLGLTRIHLDRLCVESDNGIHELTHREGRFLKLLLENAGRVLAREQIQDYVWGIEGCDNLRTIDNLVTSLRKKLGSSAASLESVRGLGYCLVLEQEASPTSTLGGAHP